MSGYEVLDVVKEESRTSVRLALGSDIEAYCRDLGDAEFVAMSGKDIPGEAHEVSFYSPENRDSLGSFGNAFGKFADALENEADFGVSLISFTAANKIIPTAYELYSELKRRDGK